MDQYGFIIYAVIVKYNLTTDILKQLWNKSVFEYENIFFFRIEVQYIIGHSIFIIKYTCIECPEWQYVKIFSKIDKDNQLLWKCDFPFFLH